VLKTYVIQNSKNDLNEHDAYCWQRFESHDNVQFMKFFNVLVVVAIVVVVIVVIVFVVFFSSFVVSIVSIWLIFSILMISFQMKMLISTFVLHVIITFTMNAFLYLNDDQILDRKRKNKDDDCHDYDEFDENKIMNKIF
jgi:hypothetical protein